jgi:hypothetical protein
VSLFLSNTDYNYNCNLMNSSSVSHTVIAKHQIPEQIRLEIMLFQVTMRSLTGEMCSVAASDKHQQKYFIEYSQKL